MEILLDYVTIVTQKQKHCAVPLNQNIIIHIWYYTCVLFHHFVLAYEW